LAAIEAALIVETLSALSFTSRLHFVTAWLASVPGESIHREAVD